MSNLIAKSQTRNVKIPANRVKPLKDNFEAMRPILVKQLKLQYIADIKQNPVTVYLRSPTNNEENLQKGVEFLNAFVKGFELKDCVNFVSMDGFHVKTIYIKEINRIIKGDHLTRAVGRVCGTNGIMLKKIENATICRILINDSTLHLMGPYKSIEAAHRMVSALLRGAPINKVVGKLASVRRNLNDTF